MSDIRLFTTTGIYEGTSGTSEVMLPTPLSDSTTSTLETIGGKVAKFLLTTIGSDVFNKDYGAYLTTHQQISEAYLPRFQVEVLEDIKRCTSYIKSTEAALSGNIEQLNRINLLRISYSKNSRDRVDIYIEIKTTFGNSSLLTLPLDS